MTRIGTITRTTSETDISVVIDLDGSGQHDIATPIPFLSHMLEQLPRHGLFDLTVQAKGDVSIDGHHTTEDVGIVLGKAILQALGDRKGIRRYGSATLVMDEARVTVALDLSGRSFFVWRRTSPRQRSASSTPSWPRSFSKRSLAARKSTCTWHSTAGQNLHHIVEISFKALARALRQASELDPRAQAVIPSTKGVLD